MLHMRGQLEEHTIVDTSLMPPKEARSMLYMLLESGFVTMQVVHRYHPQSLGPEQAIFVCLAVDLMLVCQQGCFMEMQAARASLHCLLMNWQCFCIDC